MKLINNGEQFDIVWGGLDYIVPAGEFEVTNEHLGYFMVDTAKKWNKDVRITSLDASGPVRVATIKQIKKEEPVAEKEEEPVIAKKTSKKKNEAIEELEKSL